MRFCECGKLLIVTDFGFECRCGKKYDKNMKNINETEQIALSAEEQRIRKRKDYRFKYPNMNDKVERVAKIVKESDYFKDME